MHIGKWLLRSSNIFCTFFTNINFFHDFIFHESEIRTVLLEVSIELWLLKKSLLKTSKIVLMYSNSLAIHFSSMVHAKCLLPRLDRLLLIRSCLQNFYQCSVPKDRRSFRTGPKKILEDRSVQDLKIVKRTSKDLFFDPGTIIRFFEMASLEF